MLSFSISKPYSSAHALLAITADVLGSVPGLSENECESCFGRWWCRGGFDISGDRNSNYCNTSVTASEKFWCSVFGVRIRAVAFGSHA